MLGLTVVNFALLAVLVAVWGYTMVTARRIASASPDGEAPRPRRPVKGLTLGGMVLWFISASLPDPGLRAVLYYGGWACVYADAGWYLWALKRLDRGASRNLD